MTRVREDVERELRRVVDRLTTVPLNRLADCGPACADAAAVLLAHTRARDAAVPEDAALPVLAPHGLGAMIAVLGRDYLAVVDDDPGADEVLAALVGLRRALP